jgi:hypothetical protein
VVGGYDIVFSNNFGITIPSGTVYGDGTLNFGLVVNILAGAGMTSINFTINSTNKYIVYSFTVVSVSEPIL